MPPTRFAGTAAVASCRCGHPRSAHAPFRSGSDCGTGGASHCARFCAAESPIVRGINRMRGRPRRSDDLAPVVEMARPSAPITRRSA